MRVENGSKPENGTVCKDGLQTEVIFVCDKTSQWNGQDISDYIQLVYHHGDDPCMVCFESMSYYQGFTSNHACFCSMC